MVASGTPSRATSVVLAALRDIQLKELGPLPDNAVSFKVVGEETPRYGFVVGVYI